MSEKLYSNPMRRAALAVVPPRSRRPSTRTAVFERTFAKHRLEVTATIDGGVVDVSKNPKCHFEYYNSTCTIRRRADTQPPSPCVRAPKVCVRVTRLHEQLRQHRPAATL